MTAHDHRNSLTDAYERYCAASNRFEQAREALKACDRTLAIAISLSIAAAALAVLIMMM